MFTNSGAAPIDSKIDPLNINKLKNDEISQLRSISIRIFAFFSFAIISAYISNLEKKEDEKLGAWGLLTNSAFSMWTFMGGGILMASLLQSPSQELYSLLIPYLPKQMLSKDYLSFEKTLAAYLEMRDSLSDVDRKNIDDRMLELRARSMGYGDTQQHIGRPSVFQSTLTYINMIIIINNSKKHIGLDQTKLPALTVKLDQIFSTYPYVKETLMPYLRALISSDLINTTNRPRPLFFVGAPGVGKTVLAHTLFEALQFNIHLVPISELIEKPRNDYDKIYHNFDTQKLSPFVKANYNSALKSGSSKYTVVIIDEIDKLLTVDDNGELANDNPILITKLLELCDPNKRYFYDTSIEANIDMQRTIVVILANKDIFANSPISRRLLTVNFPPIEIKLKMTISNTKINELCQELQIKLKPEERAYLVDLIAKNNKDGVGELLEDIKDFLNNLRSVSVFNNTTWEISSQTMLTQYNSQAGNKTSQQEGSEPLNEITTEKKTPEDQHIHCNFWG